MPNRSIPRLDVRRLYDRFDAPVTDVDCGVLCAPHNLSGKPFCCDTCQAVPAVYYQEWQYLRQNTDLWHVWRGDECADSANGQVDVRSGTPENMLLLACKGPEHCQRRFRTLSCREFPFFPYITSDYRFLGLAYDWAFETTCWVISHLDRVSGEYQSEFIQAYDDLFSLWPEEMDSYASLSEMMREHFAQRHRRIPLLHRGGGYYLISPVSERLRRADPQRLPRFGPYHQDQRENQVYQG